MEIASQLIWEYIQTLTDVDDPWQTEEFRRRAYERWAATMIWEEVINHPEKRPTQIIEEFWVTMELYTYTAKCTEHAFMFETGKQVAEDIMLLFV